MSTEDELRQQIEDLRSEVVALRAQIGTTGMRLGPRADTPEDIKRRTDEIVRAVSAATHEHETDHEGRQICTTSGDAPSKVRAEQAEDTGQHKSYVVLCEEERQKGFVRPYRDAYIHSTCGSVTTMGRALSETYARDPAFYGATFCCRCNRHLPVAEFVWTSDGQQVGS